MRKRIIFGAAMIAGLVGILLLDWWLEQSLRSRLRDGASPTVALPLAVVFLFITAAAFLEMVRICGASGVLMLSQSGFLGSAVLATFPFWWQFISPVPQADNLLVVLGFIVLLVFAEQMIRWRIDDAVRRLACTMLAICYLGIGGAMILQLRIRFGVPALVLFLAAVKFTDIGAYFTGSFFGKHKMIPWLSPGKSWEGLAGGVAAAVGISIATAMALGIGLELWQAAVFGAVAGLAGQFGDLCESLLKRSARIKDSGALVPEFGGVLDIIDSPLLAAPVAYLLLACWAR